MIIDGLTLLSGSLAASGGFVGQSVNGAGSFLSANTIDLAPLAIGGNQVGDFGGGEKNEFGVYVVTAPTVGTSVKFQIIQADDAALTSNVQVVNSSDDLLIARLPIGTLVPLRLNQAMATTPKRYLGMRYVNTGAIATASYVAGFLRDLQDVKTTLFKSGYSIT